MTYIEQNTLAWDSWAPAYIAAGRKAWKARELTWGIWDVPESTLGVVDGFGPGTEVVELGCGTAAISAWLARMGMRPVAVDISRQQLQTAERFQMDIGPSFSLLLANAEEIAFEDESFDLAISEYGASLWCEPRRWVHEAHRVLRPHGRLAFLTSSPLLMACTPPDGGLAGERLVRDYYTGGRIEFQEDAVEFHLTHGQWIDLLHETGFVVEKLIEQRPGFRQSPRMPLASVEWARRWPSEDVWIARKSD